MDDLVGVEVSHRAEELGKNLHCFRLGAESSGVYIALDGVEQLSAVA